jgi:hypothetical protein
VVCIALRLKGLFPLPKINLKMQVMPLWVSSAVQPSPKVVLFLHYGSSSSALYMNNVKNLDKNFALKDS